MTVEEKDFDGNWLDYKASLLKFETPPKDSKACRPAYKTLGDIWLPVMRRPSKALISKACLLTKKRFKQEALKQGIKW